MAAAPAVWMTADGVATLSGDPAKTAAKMVAGCARGWYAMERRDICLGKSNMQLLAVSTSR